MSKQDYKLVAIKLVKFLVIFVIMDFTLGSLVKQIFFSQKSGKYARLTHAIEEAEADIMIFGSSHANRHYVPSVFERELGQSAYNCGVLGQGLIFNYALEKIVLKRTKPKLIILNIDKNWVYKSEKFYDGLRDLYPYYWDHREILKPIFKLESRLIDFQLLSKAYQTNSTIIHAIKYYFSPQYADQGYVPSKKKMKPPTHHEGENPNVRKRTGSEEFDPNFIAALKSFINTARDENIELVFVISPNVHETDFSTHKSFNKIKEIVKEESVTFFDFSNDRRFLNAYSLFNDRSHLNDEGAHLFSKILTENIKKSAIITDKKWAKQDWK